MSDPSGNAIGVQANAAIIRIPASLNGKNLSGATAALSAVSSSGIPTINLKRSRRTNATTRSEVAMLTTKLTIDATEFDSIDAAVAVVIDTANDDVVTGDQIHIDIDVAGTGAKGLVVELTFS